MTVPNRRYSPILCLCSTRMTFDKWQATLATLPEAGWLNVPLFRPKSTGIPHRTPPDDRSRPQNSSQFKPAPRIARRNRKTPRDVTPPFWRSVRTRPAASVSVVYCCSSLSAIDFREAIVSVLLEFRVGARSAERRIERDVCVIEGPKQYVECVTGRRGVPRWLRTGWRRSSRWVSLFCAKGGSWGFWGWFEGSVRWEGKKSPWN